VYLWKSNEWAPYEVQRMVRETMTGAQSVNPTGLPQSPATAKLPAKPVVYACSGCSDAGELADRIARALTHTGVAEMSCLAGIGGRVKSIMAKGEKAERILVIDGCTWLKSNTIQSGRSHQVWRWDRTVRDGFVANRALNILRIHVFGVVTVHQALRRTTPSRVGDLKPPPRLG
jgi:uncharacterized metal-binding protein